MRPAPAPQRAESRAARGMRRVNRAIFRSIVNAGAPSGADA
ncbi:hypothetical protein C7S13_8272 [Burkholderia cepacia]|nr:hypothetical protein [Burkholderia cepacia]MDW9246166.1 hypothetical protein [Burkholderia cepacia]